MTSNIKISELYKDGLQRDQFKPFISIMENRSIEHKLMIDDDYRKAQESDKQRYFFPLNQESNFKINKFFRTSFHLVRNNKKYYLKQTTWYLMSSNYEGDLIPQIDEGIKSVKWKNLKQVKKIKEKTFKNISIILDDYLKEF